LLPLLAAAPPAVAAASFEVEPFLKSSGATGFLAEEEEALLQLRKEKELQARAEIERDRSTLEAEARDSQKGLCVLPATLCVAYCVLLFTAVILWSIFVAGITTVFFASTQTMRPGLSSFPAQVRVAVAWGRLVHVERWRVSMTSTEWHEYLEYQSNVNQRWSIDSSSLLFWRVGKFSLLTTSSLFVSG
jgi:hypothetical protein